MTKIDDLRRAYFFFTSGIGQADACVDWAIERLQKSEENDDTDIRLLAGSMNEGEVRHVVPRILRKYLGHSVSDEHLAGKFIADLHQRYRASEITIEELDPILSKLFHRLSMPDWLVMLCRNCEYATDMHPFVKHFEDEFDYIAGLWDKASSLESFMAAYDRTVSNKHDI
jgi:hypothetical protein